MGAGNITIYAQWQIIDTTPPTLSMVSAIGNIGVLYQGHSYAVNTFTFSDAQSGIYGYYWGTTYPSATNVPYTPYTGTSITLNNNGGVYYFAIKDNAGNISVFTSTCEKGEFGGDSGTKNIYTSGFKTFYASGNSPNGFGIASPSGTAVTYGISNNGCVISDCNNYDYLNCQSSDTMCYIMFN